MSDSGLGDWAYPIDRIIGRRVMHCFDRFSKLCGALKRAVALCVLWLAPVAMSQTYNWAPLPVDWGRIEGAADQSALNEPIHSAHELRVAGRHFMTLGVDQTAGTTDDQRIRLFGINLGRDACFPPKNKAREVATTLRSLGFNAVRLHQMDAAPSDDTNVFQSTLTQGPYPSLHAGSLDRLRHFIAELKAQGIYINLNLMVGYMFRPDIDGVPALDQQGTAPGYGSPVHVFFPKMVELQTAYARNLISDLQLGNDPVLAQVEIINESSLAAGWLHWDKTYWDKQIAGAYAKELDLQWQRWVEQTHGNLDTACKLWGTCPTETGRMLTPIEADRLQHAISADWWIRLKQKLRHMWATVRAALGLPARPQPPGSAHPKVVDALKFVAETDRSFVEHMRSVVHEATRPTLPVTGTQMDFGAPLNFASHQKMDYVDAHFYVDHPVFPGIPWSDTDWHMHNETISGREIGDLLSLAAFRDHSKPFVVSEFNQPFPNTHGHDVLPVTAAFAAQQDWDGLYFFAYGGTTEDHNVPAHFFLQGDSAKTSVVGMAARLFRTETVPPAQSSLMIETTPSDWWSSAAMERRPDTWHRHLAQRQIFNSNQALTQAVAFGGTPQPPDPATFRIPVFKHIADERLTLIESGTVNALLGEVANRTPAVAGSLSITVDSPEPRERTAVVLNTLDGLPVQKSGHMLIALPGPITGSQMQGSQARPQKRIPYRSETGQMTLEPVLRSDAKPSASRKAVAPVWIHRQPITVRIATRHQSAVVYPLTTRGHRMSALAGNAVRFSPSSLEIKLNADNTPVALWYEIVLQ